MLGCVMSLVLTVKNIEAEADSYRPVQKLLQ